MPHRRTSRPGALRALLALFTVAAVALGGYALHAQAQPAAGAPADLRAARDLGRAFATVAERVSPAVVSVRVEVVDTGRGRLPFLGPNDGIARGGGSGAIVRADGIVVTNNHVVDRAHRIEVELQDGRQFLADVVGTDPATDLAVLRIPARNLPTVAFADSRRVQPGQWAIAIGSPFGLDYSVTTGVVSSVGRGLGLNEIEDYIQTDASINPGNSGGPLVDLDGRVIGINTMIIGRGSGIGFAVSSELAQRVVDQILRHGRTRRAWIGVQFQELTPELAGAFQLGDRGRAGALIADVVQGGPAARAGLRPGDVVVRVDGQPVREARDLLREVLRHDVGARLRLEVMRGGQARRVELTSGERPSAQPEARPAPAAPRSGGGGPLHGLQVQRDRSGGVRVSGVASGSDADRAGLRPGDLIVEADGSRVRDPQQVARALADGRALFRVRRGNGALYAIVAD
ncbi:MAG: trypsin-like peptidase domain-containing protein [Sandaracinaceae bacterium]